jgi:hypothetical protein
MEKKTNDPEKASKMEKEAINFAADFGREIE